ncbi:hypothetical protein C8R43DRAFT_945722 [Mycena crocata]|nr:hypothetical protein C8R43DRAFT_945722 [Mycena crocata]
MKGAARRKEKVVRDVPASRPDKRRSWAAEPVEVRDRRGVRDEKDESGNRDGRGRGGIRRGGRGGRKARQRGVGVGAKRAWCRESDSYRRKVWRREPDDESSMNLNLGGSHVWGETPCEAQGEGGIALQARVLDPNGQGSSERGGALDETRGRTLAYGLRENGHGTGHRGRVGVCYMSRCSSANPRRRRRLGFVGRVKTRFEAGGVERKTRASREIEREVGHAVVSFREPKDDRRSDAGAWLEPPFAVPRDFPVKPTDVASQQRRMHRTPTAGTKTRV